MVWCPPKHIRRLLAENHYLGFIDRGAGWVDEYGAIIIAKPTARHLPQHWLELVRWCIVSRVPNAGSRQWAAFAKALRHARPDVTTIVSYSDPSRGHTGALYRACNWVWAPTWHRLEPPPTGNGNWHSGQIQPVKDRWIFRLRDDPGRTAVLRIKDEAILRRWPEAEYHETNGVPYKRFVALLASPKMGMSNA